MKRNPSDRSARVLAQLLERAAEAPPITDEMKAQLQEMALSQFKPPQQQRARKQANWRHQAAKRHASKLQRTPPWADMEAIRQIYREAQRLTAEAGIPHHVDHVIPLQGRNVSGLHVHTNMQILTGSDNSKKWNRFEQPESPAQRE